MSPDLALLPIVVGVGLFVGCAVMLLMNLGQRGQALDKRAHRLIEDMHKTPRKVVDESDRRAQRRRNEVKRQQSLDGRLTALLPDPAFLRLKIARTGHAMSPWTFFGACLALAAVVIVVLSVLVHQPPMIAGPAGVVVGFGLPYMVLGFLAKRRLTRFVNMMPEAIDVIVRGVRSGLPVTEAIATVSREMEDPIGTEFRRIIDIYRLGRPLGQALTEAAQRLNVPEFNFLVVALSIQQETGGNLSETLANLADIIRKRRQLRLKVKALTGEAKASAAVVGSLPFLLFLVISFLNPGYTDVFFEDSRGNIMLAAGLTSMFIGMGIMYKLANFDF